jgi:hypothetical protein
MQFLRATANTKSIRIPVFPVVPARAFALLVLQKKSNLFENESGVPLTHRFFLIKV